MRFTFLLVLIGTMVFAGACDDRSMPGNDGGMDGGGASCTGSADGTSCGTGLICVSQICVASVCGDGVHDPAIEECDDGNERATDGCDPGTCVFSCSDDTRCDDGNFCNGVELCNSHICEYGTSMPVDTACTTATISDGVCRGSGSTARCAPRGCGDSAVVEPEECDDGHDMSGDGCENDCTFTCAPDRVCTDDGDPCTIESCDPVTHLCSVRTVEPTTWYVDCDGDGYANNPTGALQRCVAPPGSSTGCSTPSPAWTGDLPQDPTWDCDDLNASRRKGFIEVAGDPGDVDENCDLRISCYANADNDSHRVDTEITNLTGTCGTTGRAYASRPNGDCCDSDPNAFPGQTACFVAQRGCGGGWDYNCANGDEGCDTTLSSGTCGTRFTCGNTPPTPGWTGSPPGCAQYGNKFLDCILEQNCCTEEPCPSPPCDTPVCLIETQSDQQTCH